LSRHQLLADGISRRQCGHMPLSFTTFSTDHDKAELFISADVTSFGCSGDMPSVEVGELRPHHFLSHLRDERRPKNGLPIPSSRRWSIRCVSAANLHGSHLSHGQGGCFDPAWGVRYRRAGWRVISQQARSQDNAFDAERTGPDGCIAGGSGPLEQVLRCWVRLGQLETIPDGDNPLDQGQRW
jgi:hypothetical protein